MSTTNAFVEIIVSGVLSLAAVLLLALGIFDLEAEAKLLLADQGYLAPAVLAVSAYAFGVAFDRIWDACARPFDRGVRYVYFASHEEINGVRARVVAESERLTNFLDYIRTRLRIARNCMFAFPLVGVGVATALHRVSDAAVAKEKTIGILIAFFAVGGLFFIAFKRLLHGYYEQLRHAGNALEAAAARATAPTE